MRVSRCPHCDSPSAELHPAMQHEGEVQPCLHEWHNDPESPGAQIARWIERQEQLKADQIAIQKVR